MLENNEWYSEFILGKILKAHEEYISPNGLAMTFTSSIQDTIIHIDMHQASNFNIILHIYHIRYIFMTFSNCLILLSVLLWFLLPWVRVDILLAIGFFHLVFDFLASSVWMLLMTRLLMAFHHRGWELVLQLGRGRLLVVSFSESIRLAGNLHFGEGFLGRAPTWPSWTPVKKAITTLRVLCTWINGCNK